MVDKLIKVIYKYLEIYLIIEKKPILGFLPDPKLDISLLFM